MWLARGSSRGGRSGSRESNQLSFFLLSCFPLLFLFLHPLFAPALGPCRALSLRTSRTPHTQRTWLRLLPWEAGGFERRARSESSRGKESFFFSKMKRAEKKTEKVESGSRHFSRHFLAELTGAFSRCTPFFDKGKRERERRKRREGWRIEQRWESGRGRKFLQMKEAEEFAEGKRGWVQTRVFFQRERKREKVSSLSSSLFSPQLAAGAFRTRLQVMGFDFLKVKRKGGRRRSRRGRKQKKRKRERKPLPSPPLHSSFLTASPSASPRPGCSASSAPPPSTPGSSACASGTSSAARRLRRVSRNRRRRSRA